VKKTETRILCVGLTPAVQEIRHFDALAVGEVNRARRVIRSPAGKGPNVAHVLKALGARPMLVVFAGGHTGEMFLGHMGRIGVACDIVGTKAPTRVCVTLIEGSTGRTTELVEESSLPTAAEWRRFQSAYNRLVKSAGVVTLAGALMPGAPESTYRHMAAVAHRNGAAVLIDSQGRPLLQALAEKPLLAKLNVAELQKTLGRKMDSAEKILSGARKLAALGAENVLVTHGAKGAWLATSEDAWRYSSPRVPSCNPIGSGDAVTAGIAFALGRGDTLVEAVRLGIACGAANVLTPTPGTVRKTDVKRLLPLVKRVRAKP
jgi:1-phosphofructokinase family hexose kinase